MPLPRRVGGRLRAVAQPLPHARVERGEIGVGEDRVGEEGAGRPGVVVLRVEDHSLPGAQLQHGLAGLGERHPVPGLDAQRACRLGVLQGRRQPVRVLEGEPDAQDDIALGVGLEAAVPVGEGALLVGERDRLARPAVVRDHLGDRRGDLLAVRPDVLDRGRARRAGDAGQALDAGQSGLHGTGDRVGPDLARGQLQPCPDEFAAARGDAQGGALEALVADDEVRAAADDQQRRAVGVGLAYGCDHLGVGRRGHQPGGGTAQSEGGQRGERGIVEFLHAPQPTRHHRQPRPPGPRQPAPAAPRR